MMHRVRHAPFFAILLALAACGPNGATSGSTTPSAPLPAGGKAVEPGAPAVPWKDKTLAQRVEFMGLVFFPQMQTLFDARSAGAAPAEGHAAFRCQTCHGEDMVDVSYAMPNGLFPLPRAAPYEAALARDEATARFMMERVVPAARELLGESDGKAIGCHTCHAAGDLTPRRSE